MALLGPGAEGEPTEQEQRERTQMYLDARAEHQALLAEISPPPA
jgi:hypothetical protein